jgi:tRNA threonylcarbamoyladenosine biosynthesis protein TsaE
MIIFNSVDETMAWAAAWAAERAAPGVLTLTGPLGAGKTVVVKGLARGLGFAGEVTSPTFTLLHEYHGGKMPLYHFDLYRLESASSVQRLGLEDYLPADGLTVIEWPERIPGLLPSGTDGWQIEIVSETTRGITAIRHP